MCWILTNYFAVTWRDCWRIQYLATCNNSFNFLVFRHFYFPARAIRHRKTFFYLLINDCKTCRKSKSTTQFGKRWSGAPETVTQHLCLKPRVMYRDRQLTKYWRGNKVNNKAIKRKVEQVCIHPVPVDNREAQMLSDTGHFWCVKLWVLCTRLNREGKTCFL